VFHCNHHVLLYTRISKKSHIDSRYGTNTKRVCLLRDIDCLCLWFTAGLNDSNKQGHLYQDLDNNTSMFFFHHEKVKTMVY
jgi:hypothetical protein